MFFARFGISCYICGAVREGCRHILMKVYSLLSLNGNLVNFKYHKESNALITCIGVLALSLPYTYQYGCGVLFICDRVLLEPPF